MVNLVPLDWFTPFDPEMACAEECGFWHPERWSFVCGPVRCPAEEAARGADGRGQQ